MMTALAIGLVLGVTVWWILIQRLKDKPWERQGVIEGSQDGLTSSAPKVGLWVFMAMAASLFLIFNGAYVMRMGFGHGELMGWVPVDEPGILWLNTFVLVAASAAMQTATGAARKGDLGALRTWFTAGGVLSVVFLAGQLLAWQQLAATGEYGVSDPAYTFFILLTAIHGLHLAGGLVVLGRTAARIWRDLGAGELDASGQGARGVRTGGLGPWGLDPGTLVGEGLGTGEVGAKRHDAGGLVGGSLGTDWVGAKRHDAGGLVTGGLDADGVVDAAKIRQTVRLCTTYWHFLLLVWLGLFTQLSIT